MNSVKWLIIEELRDGTRPEGKQYYGWFTLAGHGLTRFDNMLRAKLKEDVWLDVWLERAMDEEAENDDLYSKTS
jgi:hypothetical protein